MSVRDSNENDDNNGSIKLDTNDDGNKAKMTYRGGEMGEENMLSETE